MAQNEMRAMRGMPLRVRSMEGLGAAERCRVMAVNEAASCGSAQSWSSGFRSQSVPLGWCKTNAGSLPASLRDGQPAPAVRVRPGRCQRHDLSKFVIEPCKGERCSTHGAAMEGKGMSLTGVRAWQCIPTQRMARRSHERNERAAHSSDLEQAHKRLNARHEPRNCAHSWLRSLTFELSGPQGQAARK